MLLFFNHMDWVQYVWVNNITVIINAHPPWNHIEKNSVATSLTSEKRIGNVKNRTLTHILI